MIEQLEEQTNEDLRTLMSHEWGRRVARWLIHEVGGVQGLSFDSKIKDGLCSAMHMTHAEGRRAVALEIHERLELVSPMSIIKMETERMALAEQIIRLGGSTSTVEKT